MKKKRCNSIRWHGWEKLFLMMRVTVYFMLLGLVQVSASVYSQQTNLKLKLEKSSIEQVLRSIEEQSHFSFLYRSDLLSEMPPVSIQVTDAKLESILDKILIPNSLSYEITDQVVVIKRASERTPVPAVQQKAISGTVRDSNGESVPGTSVVIKGTTMGTITDMDGGFQLNVPADAQTLVFSFVGMVSQEVALAGRSTFDIVLLSQNVGVDEVIVVGYGTQKKVNLTGAVSSVKIDEKITSRTLSNVSSGLNGLVPGLAVNQNSGMAGRNNVSMVIRGLGTVNNANPLVVVDGMPDVDINRLNMNDIESISVLKDATSSAVYGSRAANGVILITTKSGKGMDKTRINFTSSYAIEQPTKAYEFMADYPRALTLHQRAADVNTLRSNFKFKDGTVDQWMALGMIDPLRYPNTDWWDVLMREGQVQNHNLSASGGNEKSNFYISVGMMDQKGLQINNDYSRYNARFNYDYKVRHNMNVGARFAGDWSKYTFALEDGFREDDNTAGDDLQYAISGITPYDPVTGNFGGVMAYNEDPQAYNPYTLYVNNLNYQNRQEASTSMYWDWTPVKGLTARVDYSLNYYNQFRYTAGIPNQAFNFQTNAFGSRTYVGTNAGVGNYTNTGFKTLLNGRLNYQTTIGKNHDIGALFVYGEEYWYGRSQSGTRTDRYNPSLHELDAALSGATQTSGGNSSTEGLRSYIGRLNYAAYDKYLLEVNFRYDGSSKFLPGSQFGFFPSAAIGWRFTEENFLRPALEGWLSNGKVRVSYGGLGNNSGVDRYEQQETLDPNHYMIANSIALGLVNKKMVNPELSWETTSVLNIGLDLGFFNNRLTSEIDYYDRLTSGMNRPSEMSILLTGAYEAPRINIGNLRNRGIEGNFTWKDNVRDFTYSFNLNGSYNETVLEEWNEFLGKGYTFLNMPYHFLYTYEDMGIAQTWADVYGATPQGASPGDILRKDLNGDGRIDGNDKKAYTGIQRDRPTTNFAFNTALGWKGFDVNVLLQGATGRKDYWINNFNNVNIGNSRYASTWDHWENPWNVENRDGEWPRLSGSNNREETTFWLDDLSYVRLKNVQLGYTLPKSLLLKIGIEAVRIYGSAENLATFTKFRGLDPEKRGNRSDAYPLNKSFSLGINIGI